MIFALCSGTIVVSYAACLKGVEDWKTESLTTTVVCPLTKYLSAVLGISTCRVTEGVREALFMLWSAAHRVVDVGAIVFFPLTTVDTANPGSPMDTLALSSQQTKIHLSCNSTAFSFTYFRRAAQ